MSDPPELELQTALSGHVGAENQIWVLWEEQTVLLIAESSLQPNLKHFDAAVEISFCLNLLTRP